MTIEVVQNNKKIQVAIPPVYICTLVNKYRSLSDSGWWTESHPYVGRLETIESEDTEFQGGTKRYTYLVIHSGIVWY